MSERLFQMSVPRYFAPAARSFRLMISRTAALLHRGFERREGAVVESFRQRIRNRLARVCAFGLSDHKGARLMLDALPKAKT